ncbi:fatty-acid--CoA ligase [Mycolicibacterium hodleri]|uniref:Fatty-acid--CoA ligase n=1 Tax=Mycolicibacterium hodleri TaxID=49897 RepID=A0A502EFV4_9MYCO|nr:fatty-acid--CoA ligase [Mycolicibacterium hodleri]TPG36605.1 fatty-acid--CoA ligase [Mycolicibacterium hodleri]
MEPDGVHSVVLASVYRVTDPRRMWAQIGVRKSQLAAIGAHHAVVYVSTERAGWVLVTIGVRQREPVAELMLSPAIREWFDIAGVEDFPMVFAGEIVEKMDLETSPAVPPGIVVAAFAGVESVAEVVMRAHDAIDRFRSAGVRKLWTYHALDDPREMLFLHEFDDDTQARRWIAHPDTAADWMSDPVGSPYPPLFVGRLMDVLTIEPGG